MWWRAGRRLLSTAEVKRHRPVMKLENHRPVVQNDTWVAPNAAVVGNVRLGDEVSVWYGAVVRGDPNFVRIGPQSNVQEKAVIQTVETVETGFPAVVDVGECVSIGPGCVLRSCTVGKNVELGAGCLVLDGALIEDNVKLLPGTLVPPGGRIPSGEVWGGKPAKFVAKITEEEVKEIIDGAESIASMAQELKLEYLPLPDAP